MRQATTATLGEVAAMVTEKIDLARLTKDSYISTENMIPDRGGVVTAESLPPSGRVNAFSIGDTLFSNIRTYFKKVWIARFSGGASTDVIVFRPREAGQLDKAFLFYLLSSDAFIDSTITASKGTKMPRGDKEAMLRYSFELPPLPVQRRIAGILSAYDELMENSQRRIRLLEAMARALYREWFVHFRFPGHETHPRIASPLGDIPKGWEVKTLGDFVQFKSGFAFKSGTFTADGEHRLVTIKNVQDGSFNPESDSRMNELPEKMPPYCVLNDGDILLSLTGNVGRVCLVYDGPFLLNQRVSKLVPVEAFDWAMAYCVFRETAMRVKLEQISNGVAQQNLSPIQAAQMEFVRPPRELRQRFATLAEPMVRRIVQLYTTIQNLRRTRDLLLPRLLSGQVELNPKSP